MSTAKRSRQRQSEAAVATSLPPAKKAKTSQDSHVPSNSLDFLTDERKRAGKTLKASLTNGARDTPKSLPDESKANISNHAGGNHDVDMDDVDVGAEDESELDSEDDIDEEGEDDALHAQANGGPHKTLTNGVSNHNLESSKSKTTNANDATDDVDDPAGPSFGDLLQAAHPETIDVQAAFTARDQEKALVPTDNARNLQAPSATSLGTVLTQALRTNDKELLESCLQTKDLASIRSTIQRLQSPLVATLLQRLAERLHKRPGRAGPLMVWVQWSLVAHGGYLASQPQVTKQLKALHQVVRERANSLHSLMSLKGKLDMLSAQIELRRSMQAQRSAQYESEDDEERVVYVEGEEDESSEEMSDEEEAVVRQQSKRKPARKAKQIDVGAAESQDEDGEDDVAMINGIDDDAEESDDGEDEDGDGMGFIDDEADVTSDDENDSTEDGESADELEDEEDDDASESEEEAAPPAKRKQPLQRSSMAKRR